MTVIRIVQIAVPKLNIAKNLAAQVTLSGGEVGIVATLSATTPALVLPMLWWKTGDRPPMLAWVGAGLVVVGSGLIFAA